MIYVVYGCPQDVLIKQEVKKILKDELTEVNDFNCTYYDYSNNIDAIISDCLTLPFLDDKKAIVVKNFTPLFKDKNDFEEKEFIDYLNNPNPSTVLILTIPSSVSEKNPVTKVLKKVARMIKINDVEKKDWDEVIGRLLVQSKLDIDQKAKEEFINRTKGNLTIVMNEIQKLKNFNGKITVDVINKLVARPLEENMFGMVDALLNGDTNTALQIYYDLKLNGSDPVILISGLATQFRFLYQVRYLKDHGYSNDEIAKQLNNVSSGRIYYSIKKLGDHTCKDISKILSELADLDFDIRVNYVDKEKAFELFLISKH